jgi:hypothetical protein
MSSSPLLGGVVFALLVGLRLLWIARRLQRTARFAAIEGWTGSNVISLALVLLPFVVLYATRMTTLSFGVRMALFVAAFAPAGLVYYRARAEKEADEPIVVPPIGSGLAEAAPIQAPYSPLAAMTASAPAATFVAPAAPVVVPPIVSAHAEPAPVRESEPLAVAATTTLAPAATFDAPAAPVGVPKEEREVVFTIKVWQLALVLVGFFAVAATLVAQGPASMVTRAVGAAFVIGLLLFVVLRRRRQGDVL